MDLSLNRQSVSGASRVGRDANKRALTKATNVASGAAKSVAGRGFGFLALTATVLLGVFATGCSGKPVELGADRTALLKDPAIDTRLQGDDFAFPSKPPSLMQGREVFTQQCVKCHAASYWQTAKVKTDLAYTTPIDAYLMLTTGAAPEVTMPTPERRKLLPAHHPSFRNELSRDDRWAVIFYTRYLAGAGDIHSPDPKTDVAAIFGGNCAVCHGSKADGDGPLFTGKTANHDLHNAPQPRNLMPPPANFRQYNRVYNRTDAQLLKYICEGIYPSAMPSWYGDVNLDKDTGKVTYLFNENLITNLVRYIRSRAYENDLKPDLPEAVNPPPGLPAIASCRPVPTNRPWTKLMREQTPQPASASSLADPITGGMVSPHAPVNEPVPFAEPVMQPTETREAPR